MTTHDFTLIIEGGDVLDPAVTDALYEAGCDDALLGRSGPTQRADFGRAAPSFEEAALSAIEDVESVDRLRVVRVEPDDMATATTIAQRTGRTRQSINQLINGKRGPGDFPPALSWIDSRTRIWRWADVARWFEERGEIPRTDPAVDAFVGAVNGLLEARRQLARIPGSNKTVRSQLRGLLEPPRTRKRGRTRGAPNVARTTR